MLRKGFIFSLDMMMAVYLTLISVAVVVSAHEVLSQINFDDIQIVQYGEDFRNFDYYSPTLISGTCDIKNFYGFSDVCEGHRVKYGIMNLKYQRLSTGDPNFWFMAGSGTNHIYQEPGDIVCFGDY